MKKNLIRKVFDTYFYKKNLFFPFSILMIYIERTKSMNKDEIFELLSKLIDESSTMKAWNNAPNPSFVFSKKNKPYTDGDWICYTCI